LDIIYKFECPFYTCKNDKDVSDYIFQ
jgi:hypothetical protein